MAESQDTSRDELEYVIRARYGLIYVVSPEEERVETALRAIGESRQRKVMAWSVTEGFTSLDGGSDFNDIKDPLRALDFICNFEDDIIAVLRDYHPYLKDPSIVRRLRDLHREFKEADYNQHVVLLSAIYAAPMELEKELAVIDYDLPARQELEDIVWKVAESVPDSVSLALRTDQILRDAVVEAALGLTAEEAESVFAKSLVKTRDFDIDTILQEKKGIIRKSGILEFYQTEEKFSDVGGLEVLKGWLNKRKAAFQRDAREFGLPAPKGILLIGVPGCGKSLTAKAIGAMWKMPLLRLDVGKVFGSLVGSSEENMRRAINTAEAVAPSILWLDELEKGFSGTKSSGQTDGGTTARVFGTFVTWLQEKTSAVFVIATANDVGSLPPELLRKGRFDEIFFVDLPSPHERSEIFNIHIAKKNRDPSIFDHERLVAESQGFSGSEIEQAIISALYDAYEDDKAELDTGRVLRSVDEIIPLSYTMKEKIDAMREWAKSRARIASVYEELDRDGGGRKLDLAFPAATSPVRADWPKAIRSRHVSHFTSVKTKIRDLVCLVQAIKDLEYEFTEAKQEQLVHVRGYASRTTDAILSIHVSKTYDVGVRQTEEGFEFVADWWGVETTHGLTEEEFLRRVTQRYSYHKVMQEIEKRGFTIETEEETEEEKIHVRVRTWA